MFMPYHCQTSTMPEFVQLCHLLQKSASIYEVLITIQYLDRLDLCEIITESIVNDVLFCFGNAEFCLDSIALLLDYLQCQSLQ